MSTSGAAPAPILTDAELKLLQALVYQECGMHFDERRTHFLQDRLLRRLKECRVDSFYAYYRLLISHEGKQELAKLLENLTVNETSFFRHKAQLDLVPEDGSGRVAEAQEFAAGVFDPDMECGLLNGSGSLHAGHAGHRCAGLLLPAESAADGYAAAEAVDSSAMEGGDPCERHQLLGVAGGPGRHIQRAPDVDGRLRLPAALFR